MLSATVMNIQWLWVCMHMSCPMLHYASAAGTLLVHVLCSCGTVTLFLPFSYKVFVFLFTSKKNLNKVFMESFFFPDS